MSSLIKIKPLGTTFVDSSHANRNFSSLRKTYAGSFHTSPSTSVNFKTLVKFDSSMFYELPIEFAQLCLYVKDINKESSFYSNGSFCIYKNEENFDINAVTWNNTPLTSCCLPFSIENSLLGHYVKIDISQYIKQWLQDRANYGITIEPQNYYSSLIKFASINSNNPPLILIKYKSASMDIYNQHTSNFSL